MMTRARQQISARGALAAVAAVLATAAVAAPAFVGVTVQADVGTVPPISAIPAPLGTTQAPTGAIPDSTDVVTTREAAPDAPVPAEADREAAAAEAAVREQSNDGLRLLGNLPSSVTQDPERKLILTLSETLSADSDIGLDDGGAGFTSITRLGVRYIASGPISSFYVNSGINLNLLAGPGSSATNSNLPLPDLALGWQRALSRTTQMSLSLNGSLRPEDVAGDPTFALADTDDGGFVIVTQPGAAQSALRLSLSGSASLRHTVNKRNSLSLSFTTSKVDYIDGTTSSTPFMQTAVSTGWTGQLTPTVSSGLTASLSSYVSDAVDERSSYTLNLSGNGGWKVNQRLSLSSSLGPSLSLTSRTVNGEAVETTDVSARVSAGLSYVLSDTQLSASLSNGVQPTSLGATANVASLSANLSHKVNELSSIGVNGALSYRTAMSQQDAATVSDQMSLSARATYSYALTSDVDATLGYGFRWQDQATTSPMSHKVFLTLSRSFTLLP
jgi:hypothetical protein